MVIWLVREFDLYRVLSIWQRMRMWSLCQIGKIKDIVDVVGHIEKGLVIIIIEIKKQKRKITYS